MAKSISKKAKSTGCGCGCLWPLLFVLIYFVLPNLKLTSSFALSADEFTSLEVEAQQIRSHFQSENCEQLLNDRFGSTGDFTELCTQKREEYATAQSVDFQSARCEKTIRPFKDEKFTHCTLAYRIMLEDGTSLVETYLWSLEDGEYEFIEVAWE